MNTPGLDYVAIDFETATSERYSICSVGIVTVTGGIIMEKYFSLIQPPKNEYTKNSHNSSYPVKCFIRYISYTVAFYNKNIPLL